MSENILTIENLSKRYGAITVLDGVSLSVRAGERFGIVGESGSGKTTLLECVLGITHPDEGKVFLHGNEITDMPMEKRGIGYVPQDFGLFPHLDVEKNIAFGLTIRKTPARDMRPRIEELLVALQLPYDIIRRKPRELSGGQQQRVALARALAVSPKLVLLDEPFSNLDEATTDEVLPYFRTLHERFGATAVFVIHTIDDALKLCDRIGVFHRGRLLRIATPRELLTNPEHPQIARLLSGFRNKSIS